MLYADRLMRVDIVTWGLKSEEIWWMGMVDGLGEEIWWMEMVDRFVDRTDQWAGGKV